MCFCHVSAISIWLYWHKKQPHICKSIFVLFVDWVLNIKSSCIVFRKQQDKRNKQEITKLQIHSCRRHIAEPSRSDVAIDHFNAEWILRFLKKKTAPKWPNAAKLKADKIQILIKALYKRICKRLNHFCFNILLRSAKHGISLKVSNFLHYG